MHHRMGRVETDGEPTYLVLWCVEEGECGQCAEEHVSSRCHLASSHGPAVTARDFALFCAVAGIH